VADEVGDVRLSKHGGAADGIELVLTGLQFGLCQGVGGRGFLEAGIVFTPSLPSKKVTTDTTYTVNITGISGGATSSYSSIV
jgi:hypothetical protein